ncbi:hypothetical protein RUND412_002177 [Rhizina undulata]
MDLDPALTAPNTPIASSPTDQNQSATGAPDLRCPFCPLDRKPFKSKETKRQHLIRYKGREDPPHPPDQVDLELGNAPIPRGVGPEAIKKRRAEKLKIKRGDAVYRRRTKRQNQRRNAEVKVLTDFHRKLNEANEATPRSLHPAVAEDVTFPVLCLRHVPFTPSLLLPPGPESEIKYISILRDHFLLHPAPSIWALNLDSAISRWALLDPITKAGEWNNAVKTVFTDWRIWRGGGADPTTGVLGEDIFGHEEDAAGTSFFESGLNAAGGILDPSVSLEIARSRLVEKRIQKYREEDPETYADELEDNERLGHYREEREKAHERRIQQGSSLQDQEGLGLGSEVGDEEMGLGVEQV